MCAWLLACILYLTDNSLWAGIYFPFFVISLRLLWYFEKELTVAVRWWLLGGWKKQMYSDYYIIKKTWCISRASERVRAYIHTRIAHRAHPCARTSILCENAWILPNLIEMNGNHLNKTACARIPLGIRFGLGLVWSAHNCQLFSLSHIYFICLCHFFSLSLNGLPDAVCEWVSVCVCVYLNIIYSIFYIYYKPTVKCYGKWH